MNTQNTAEISSDVASALLDVAYEHAAANAARGLVPIGCAIATSTGNLVSSAANQMVITGDPTAHAEMTAIRKLGLDRNPAKLVLATTMSPCWMCAGTIQHLGFAQVIVGDTETWSDEALCWVEDRGASVYRSNDDRYRKLFMAWHADHADDWPFD